MLSLREFLDEDTDLLKKWLNNDHVKIWYERPEIDLYLENWLEEVQKRDAEYSWISYFIVQQNERPIGFGMYYDCYNANEDWYHIESEGEMFSIDYLIGDLTYIGRGYGKKMLKLLISSIKDNTPAKRIVVQPHEDNHSSCAVLLSTGFNFDTSKKYYYMDI
ncbi:GNAT family N-acetyltransferase [Citrobacter farmeri]|uniref:GNAT family N-acetyltransferase n=1 Tax=Citrobacter farmeri TaxID=67824 RepID=UPI0018AB0026|nr:GNAT family N-acetyltransferase [Citrobacter farmeri]MDB2179534.1 GNAT family N-acetyltransferase [Citrobacter farmeri]